MVTSKFIITFDTRSHKGAHLYRFLFTKMLKGYVDVQNRYFFLITYALIATFLLLCYQSSSSDEVESLCPYS